MIKILSIIVAISLAGALAKTLIEDLSDYESETQEKLTSISFEEYAKAQEKDPCDPFKPLVPDTSQLKTLSEINCKKHIWYLKNREEENTWRLGCELHKSKTNSNNVETQDVPIIYGGQDAAVAQFPHMGAVGWRSKDLSKQWVFKCGSTLISDKFLLTAAHCTKISPRFVPDIVNGEPEVVMLGVEDISDVIGTKERRPKIEKIKKIIVHPDYKPPKKYNDIALLEVENAIPFTSFIFPACVWPHNDVEPLTTEPISLTGWGQTEKGKASPILQVVDVEVLNTSLCDSLLNHFHNRNWAGFINTQICAGELAGGIDTCKGDSGGPLQARLLTNTNDPMYMVIGVTSFGIKCGVKNQPGVYTRVSSYVDWIEENVWNSTAIENKHTQNGTL